MQQEGARAAVIKAERSGEWLQLRSFYFFLSDKPRDDVISHTAHSWASSLLLSVSVMVSS